MNNKSKINTPKGKIYLTVVAIASLLVMAFNVNTNSMNANAIDFGLISKDTNIGSIDTSSLFNCVGAAITCDNDNTVNNNVALNNGTNGNGGGDTPLPPIDPIVCQDCIADLSSEQLLQLRLALGLDENASDNAVCVGLGGLETVEEVVLLLNDVGVSAERIVTILDCIGIDISLTEVVAIIGA